MQIAFRGGVQNSVGWESERSELLARQISALGLTVAGSRVERLVTRLDDELGARGIAFRPPVYLSDEWGCPDGSPIIGVPFYLADARLERIEEEHSGSVEGDEEAMRYLRHEAGHAMNYAFRIHDRPDFESVFGDYARPYREHYATNPMSRDHVRHILGWYAQKHPDEDFAETFAVWLTPDLDWRTEYADWPALRKLEWLDALMTTIADQVTATPPVTDEDMPVEAMHRTVGEHYSVDEMLALGDGRQFDRDLTRIFARAGRTDEGESEGAAAYLERHESELVTRIAYWAGISPGVVRSLLRALRERATVMDLRLLEREATTLIELTAFGTAVLLHWRYARIADAHPLSHET
ncbi:putative zinc-binding metallopeptidase [soil metagenome]